MTKGKSSHSRCHMYCAPASREVGAHCLFHTPVKMKSTLTSPGHSAASGGTGQLQPFLPEGRATLGKSLTISLSL